MVFLASTDAFFIAQSMSMTSWQSANAAMHGGSHAKFPHWDADFLTVHSVIFSKTLFDFRKSISGPIELKFSGKTLNSILYAPIYFWVSIFSLRA